ncbi:hypothetical protein [Nocardioides marmoribigeumensis]|uniref:Uncharacterized protein n=1 Tax=Nocardioides marmoribigeumensis TaxID=433649 RepID=A0ABU2BR82_9ACTN|nr:hypothetical protein [Nocardioides marmoribigeumensis]MDR7360494.1 hypothetical protein [Nocardioides marmoribigeumensis]
MTPARTLSAVLLSAGLALSTLPAAQADLPNRATVTDKVGDAPRVIDLKASTYSITRERATFSTTVRELTSRTFVAFEIWPLTSAWDRIAIRRVDGRTVARVYFVDNDLEDSDKPVATRTRCPGLQVSWRPRVDRVSAVVPASCLRASQPAARPFELHTFSRLGTRHDAMPKRTLD